MASSLYTIAESLRSCAMVRLAMTTGGVPNRSCVVPGEVAWDECQCGMLAVSIRRLYSSRVFPGDASQDGEFGACDIPYTVIEYAITIARCVAVTDDAGNPPPCSALDSAAQIWAEDAMAVRNGVGCCLADMIDANTIAEYTLEEQVSVGPAGGCVGSELKALVGIINKCNCE